MKKGNFASTFTTGTVTTPCSEMKTVNTQSINQMELLSGSHIGATTFGHTAVSFAGLDRGGGQTSGKRDLPYTRNWHPDPAADSTAQRLKRKHSSSAFEKSVRFKESSKDLVTSDRHAESSDSDSDSAEEDVPRARSLKLKNRDKTPARDESSDASSEEETGRIPKPQGEAGRPKRGGYNLQRVLKWPAKDFEAVKVSAFSHFDKTLSQNLGLHPSGFR